MEGGRVKVKKPISEAIVKCQIRDNSNLAKDRQGERPECVSGDVLVSILVFKCLQC